MQAAPLADPSSMSSQGRTNELALAVAKDDLLGVLLVLHYCTGGEVNGRDSKSGLTPLQTALATPIRQLNVRQLAIECLLFDGADGHQAERQRPTPSAEPLVKVVREWDTTGKAAAAASFELRYNMDLAKVEAYLRKYQLDVLSLPPPVQEPPASRKEERPRRDSHQDHPEHQSGVWVFVGGMPATVAERFLFEMLEARGVNVVEIFLSGRPDGTRFAFVQVSSQAEGRMVIESLDGYRLQDKTLVAKPFFDQKTKSRTPEVGRGTSGPYRGTKHQAERSPDGTRIGVTFMHCSNATRQQDIAQLLQSVMPASNIIRIDVKRIGLFTMAFCRLHDRELTRKAIIELDGQVLLGHALRANWMEVDRRDLSTVPGSAAFAQPLTDSGHPSSEADKPTHQPTEDLDLERDLARLRSSGVSEQDLSSVQQIWSPSSLPVERTMSVQADFGFLPQEEAKAALEANKRSPAFPDDRLEQGRYEAFLQAQAGESRAYFMVFLSQLAHFNRSTELYLSTAREKLASTTGKNGVEVGAASGNSEARGEVETEDPAESASATMDVEDGAEKVKQEGDEAGL
ncbi:hypothetical protein JCM8097_005910 [Rhodosporidiobolus ruineniae]